MIEFTLKHLERVEQKNNAWRDYVRLHLKVVVARIDSLRGFAGLCRGNKVSEACLAEADRLQKRVDALLAE